MDQLPSKSFPIKLFVRTPRREYRTIDGVLLLNHWSLHFFSLDGTLDLEESYHSIHSVERKRKESKESLSYVEIVFKQFSCWVCGFMSQEKQFDFDKSIQEYSFTKVSSSSSSQLSLLHNVPAFDFVMRLPRVPDGDGWEVYDAEKEYQRMFKPLKGKHKWVISHANKDFSICDTYPQVIALPKNFGEHLLHIAGRHRDRGRFPALSWIHPENQASLTRCSQPLPGIAGNKRSEADELLIKTIFQANPSKSLTHHHIVDARPFASAMANRAKGAGYENSEYYFGIEVDFLSIENIHHMRDGVDKMRKLMRSITPSDTSWLSKLESTNWISYIHSLLRGTMKIVKYLREGSSVVVHCSHGWDRTAQLSSLSQILLDPHYRTFRGFEQLIEKEWIQFGHQVSHRASHLSSLLKITNSGDGGHYEDEESPIFLQFIDGVHQISHQFPTLFEFNDDFLIEIVDHFYSCQYGTFLGNCLKERLSLGIRETTTSLWTYLNHPSKRASFTNILYRPHSSFSAVALATSQDKIHFWEDLYSRADFVLTTSPAKKKMKLFAKLLDQARKAPPPSSSTTTSSTPQGDVTSAPSVSASETTSSGSERTQIGEKE
eukprot:TRINITY_DN152_c2_g1_i5.p1 TRINITY_DN152_c2_g1~~TRINITY_DN152_c2_g1_i5.p1  ORF type:complete len:603 (-),score=109.51 TRINITY_DN152_c2_g1_i5:72-1880(-)